MQTTLNADAHRVIARLITTAFHVIKTDQPFASFPQAIELQQKNGVDLGTRYRTDEMLWKLLYISIEGPEVSQFQPDSHAEMAVMACLRLKSKLFC